MPQSTLIPQGWELVPEEEPMDIPKGWELVPETKQVHRPEVQQPVTTPTLESPAQQPQAQPTPQPTQAERQIYDFEGKTYSFPPSHSPESIARFFNKNVLTADRRNLSREKAGGRSQYYEAESEQKLRNCTPLGQQGLTEYAELLSGADADGNPVVVKPEDITPQGLASVIEERKKYAEEAAKQPNVNPLALQEFNEDTESMERDLDRQWATETSVEYRQRQLAAMPDDEVVSLAKQTPTPKVREAQRVLALPRYTGGWSGPGEGEATPEMIREAQGVVDDWKSSKGKEAALDPETARAMVLQDYDLTLSDKQRAADEEILDTRPGYAVRKDQPHEAFWAENLLREYQQKYAGEVPRDKKYLFDKANETYDAWLKENPDGADEGFDEWRRSKPIRKITHPEEARLVKERKKDPHNRRHWENVSEAMIARQASHADDLDWVGYTLKRIPFAGTAVEAADFLALRGAVKNVDAGKATDSDWFTVAAAIDAAQKSEDRGVGLKIWDLVSHLPGMGVEFAMTGGGFTAARAGARSLAVKAMGRQAMRSTVPRLATKAAGFAAGVAGQTALNVPLVAKSVAEKWVPEYKLTRDEAGQLTTHITENDPSFMEALAKGVGSAYIEMGTERAGASLGIVGGALAKSKAGQALAKLPGASRAMALKAAVLKRFLAKGGTAARANKILRKAGWNGLIEEVFEERLGDAARGVTGIDDDYGTLGKVLTNDPEGWEQLFVEAVAFSVIPAGQGAMMGAEAVMAPQNAAGHAEQRTQAGEVVQRQTNVFERIAALDKPPGAHKWAEIVLGDRRRYKEAPDEAARREEWQSLQDLRDAPDRADQADQLQEEQRAATTDRVAGEQDAGPTEPVSPEDYQGQLDAEIEAVFGEPTTSEGRVSEPADVAGESEGPATLNRQQRIAARAQELESLDTDELKAMQDTATGVDREAIAALFKYRGLGTRGETKTEQSSRETAEALQSAERDEAKDQRVSQQFDEADAYLRQRGWELEHASDSGSRYYVKGDERLRVADHNVPHTPQRNSEGFSWADSGSQIVLPVEDVQSALGEFTESPADAEVYAGSVRTPNDVEDTAKRDEIQADMEENGWRGRPLIALEAGDGYISITGSHRTDAARRAGIDVPVMTISEESQNLSVDAEPFHEAIQDRSLEDDDRLRILREFATAFPENEEFARAVTLMEQEPDAAAESGAMTEPPPAPASDIAGPPPAETLQQPAVAPQTPAATNTPSESPPPTETREETAQEQETAPESPWSADTRKRLAEVPAFSGSTIDTSETDRTATVTRADGRRTTVHFDHDMTAIAKKKGRKAETVKGAYVFKQGKKGELTEGDIYLAPDAGHDTLNHEVVHWLEDEGVITPAEVKKYGGREAVAKKYGKWAAKRKPDTVFERVYEFLEPLFSSQRRFFEEVGKRGVEATPEAPDYGSWLKPQLQAEAKRLDLPGRGGATKAKLVAMLEDHDATKGEKAPETQPAPPPTNETTRIADKLIEWKQGERLTDPNNFRSSWAGWDDAKRKAIVKELGNRGELPIGMDRRKTVTASQILEELPRRLASKRYKKPATLRQKAAQRSERTSQALKDAGEELKQAFQAPMGIVPDPKRDAETLKRQIAAAVKFAKAATDHGVSKFAEYVALVAENLGYDGTLAAGDVLERAWGTIRQRPDFTHLDEAGKTADVLEKPAPRVPEETAPPEPPKQPEEAVEKPPVAPDKHSAKAKPPSGEGMTGIKKARLEQQAAAMGMAPPNPAESVKAIDVVEQAVANWTPEADEQIQQRAAEIIADPRQPISLEEAANLLASVDYNRRKADEASDRGAEETEEFHRAAMQNSAQAARLMGSQWAYMGHIYQLLVDKDGQAYIERVLKKANGGHVNPEDAEWAKQHADKLDKAKKKQAKRGKQIDEQGALAQANEKIAELEGELKRERTRSKTKRGSKNTVFTQSARDAAFERLRKRGLVAASNPAKDVIEGLADAAILAGYYVEAGARQLADFSRAMVGDLGDWVKPHLEELHRTARAEVAKVRQEKLRERLADRITEIPEGKRDEGLAAQHRSVRELGKEIIAETRNEDGSFIARGEINPADQVSGETTLLDLLHAELQEIDPNITRREALDMFSGYGKWTPFSKDDVDIKVAQYAGEAQKLGQLDDMSQKMAPKPTGRQQHEPSDDERELRKGVNAAKKQGEKEGWYHAGTGGKKLKSTLDATKTRLRNEITDLQGQLESGVKTVRNKTAPLTDAEKEALVKQRDVLKERLNAVVRAAEDADMSRWEGEGGAVVDPALEKYLGVLDRQITSLKKQLATKDVFPKAVPWRPVGQAVNIKKAQIEALQAEKALLRKILDPDYETNRKLLNAEKAAERELAKLEKERKEGFKMRDKPEPPPESGKLKETRAKLKELREQRRDALEDEYALKAAIAQSKRNAVNIAERIARGDFAPKKRKPARTWDDPEWKAAKEEELALRKELAEKIAEYEWQNMDGWETTKFYAKRVRDVWKAVMTGFDQTALGLQGGIVTFTNPVVWSKALVPTGKALVSAKNREMLDAERESHPNYERYKNYGVALREHGESKDMASTEFYGNDAVIDRIPGVALSERSFSTFLNELRFNLMQVMEWSYTKDGQQLTQQQGEALARIVNAFTFAYKPKSHKVRSAMDLAGEVFWAPSMYVARLQLAVGSPALFNPGADSRVRMIAAKQYLKAVVGVAGLTAVARMLLADDDDDDELTPVDPDYYKVKSGNTRMDLTSGMGQMATFGARTLNSLVKARTGEPLWKSKGRQQGTREIFGSFASFKTNPWVSAGFDITSETDVLGRPTSLGNILLSNITPLSVQTLVEAVEEEGVAEGLAWTVPGVTGRNLSIYDRSAPKSEETFLATAKRLGRRMTGAKVPGLKPDEMDKWLQNKVEWNTDLSSAGSFLTPAQMKQAEAKREEKKQTVLTEGLKPAPERKAKETDTSYQKKLDTRKKARDKMQDMLGTLDLSHEDAQQLLVEYYRRYDDGKPRYSKDKRMFLTEGDESTTKKNDFDESYYKAALALAELYGHAEPKKALVAFRTSPGFRAFQKKWLADARAAMKK